MLRPFLAVILALILLTPAPARAADHIAIDASFVGLDAMAAFSPTDAFLRECFRALGPRIVQIPSETGDGDPREAGAVAAFWESMRGRKHVRLAYNDDDPANPRVRLHVEIQPVEPEKTADMARAMAFIAEEEGLALVSDGPLRKFRSETGDEIAFGIRRDGRFIVMINGLDQIGAPAGSISGAPADAPILLRLHVNGPNISRLLAMVPQDDPEDAAKGFAALTALGLYGENAMSLDVGAWNVGNGLEGTATFRKLHTVSFPGENPPPTLGDAFLSMIPADVTSVHASVWDLSALDRMIVAADPQGRAEMSRQSIEALGFDVWGDLLAHLGPRYAWYQSDRTGGGGLFSTVVLAELRNGEAFAASHATLVRRINEFGAGMAKGYVRIEQVDVGAQPAFMLHAPGLPLPVAPMWAIVGNTVIAGATPVAFNEALAIAKSKGPSIATNSAVRERLGGNLSSAAGLCYSDTPRLARTSVGAGTAMLIMAANAARVSPAAPAPALPTPAAFLEGVRPCIGWSTWSGDDLVFRWSCDDSLTVLGSVMVTRYEKIIAVQTIPMLLNSRLHAAAAEARVVSPEELGAAKLQQIFIGVAAWSASNQDTLPPNLDALIDGGMLDAGMLRSPFGPVEGAKWDYVIRTDFTKQASIDLPSSTVLIVDVAAMRSNQSVPVAYADGHVETVTREELDVLLLQPQNLGMRKALGID